MSNMIEIAVMRVLWVRGLWYSSSVTPDLLVRRWNTGRRTGAFFSDEKAALREQQVFMCWIGVGNACCPLIDCEISKKGRWAFFGMPSIGKEPCIIALVRRRGSEMVQIDLDFIANASIIICPYLV